MGVYKEMEQAGYLNLADVYRASNSGVYGKMYHLINQYDATGDSFGLMNTEEARNAYLRARPSTATPTGSTYCSTTTSPATMRSACQAEPTRRHTTHP